MSLNKANSIMFFGEEYDRWNATYSTVSATSGTWTIYGNFYSLQPTLQDFISLEWYNGIITKGGTVVLNNEKVYMLATSDGSSVNHYIEINSKPISNFIISAVSSYGSIDSYLLSDFSSAKYTIEVRDPIINKIHYSEINIISDGTEAVTSEFGILYTGNTPMIEYGASTDGIIVSLTARALSGNTNDKIFKCLRTNLV